MNLYFSFSFLKNWDIISIYRWPSGKEFAANVGDMAVGSIPGSGDALEKKMATHSSILAWKIPWTEKTGRLWSTGLQRVGYYWVTEHTISIKYYVRFRCKTSWFSTYILQNDHYNKSEQPPLHKIIFLVMRPLKIYSLSNLQIYNIVLLTLVTILHMMPQDFFVHLAHPSTSWIHIFLIQNPVLLFPLPVFLKMFADLN